MSAPNGPRPELLIQDGAMALDDPARRWLPELAEPRDFWAAAYAAIDG